MEIQPTVYYIWAVTGLIALLLLLVNGKLRKFDPLDKPTGVVLVCMMAAQAIENIVREKTNERLTRKLSPYIATVSIYIFISNIAGLFSLECPTANYSVTLTLAAITCVLIEVCSARARGPKKYLKSWFEPFAPFVLINIISKISTLASLSLRLFGNIIAGSILMKVIYSMLAAVSSAIPFLHNFNLFGVAIAPVLHFYFDLFSGAMQTYIFVILSVSFIGKELPENE
ncbi:MAG: F0F1 ATP synthase subunit A [Erysipelotrichaceae bacterium]|nr:F0F1 ATP synthase subunit A [Erysipelotrichaceae bacterium]MBR5048704.1 F0F1 ATP synthase subunit A [Erysipelotrichaceae bacterium]